MKNIFICITILTTLNTYGALTENVSLNSDYIWRGVTQTNHNAAVQGGIDFNHDLGFNLGTWLSNTDSNTKAEQDIYAGYKYAVNENISLGLSYTFYHYLQRGSLDSHEMTFKIGAYQADLSINYTDDYFGTQTSSFYYNLLRRFTLCSKHNLAALVSVGYTTFDNEQKANIKDYVDYKLGLERIVDTYSVGFYYTDTNRKDSSSNKLNDQSYFITLSKNF